MNTLVSKHRISRRTAGFVGLTAAVVLVADAGTAMAAGTETASLGISATVANTCKIESTSNVNFTTYDPTSTTDTATNSGQIRVKCTKGSTSTIYMGAGTASGATCSGTPVRKMANGADLLTYNLYQNNGYTTVWGCDSSNQYSYTASNNGWQNLTVYGVIPAGQDVPAGSYTDTVTVTVNF